MRVGQVKKLIHRHSAEVGELSKRSYLVCVFISEENVIKYFFIIVYEGVKNANVQRMQIL